MAKPPATNSDPWHHLQQLTPARIALGRSGGSLPTRRLLDFQLAHARARDAVQREFNLDELKQTIERLGLPTLVVESAAPDHLTYLKRPELGRRLSDAGRRRLEASAKDVAPPDLVIVVSDGLSSLAAERHAPSVLEALLPLVTSEGWSVGPLVLVPRARVALQDQVGQLLGAKAAVILLGERPGLASPDSLGAYVVYRPKVGLTDADRNCISNIRPEGLAPAAAAAKILYLVRESLRRRLSGVALKDESAALPVAPASKLPQQ